MAFQTKGSRFALKEEVTEGELLAPTASTDYLALQDGFSVEPAFEILENAELRGDIPVAAPQLGQENPTKSGSHYVKHSGVVGTAPEDNLILKSAFGTETIRATERDTVGGSTVSVVKVDVGEGVEFVKGDVLLVKHASFAHELGVVDSVSTDDLTLAFDLANAPASGTNLGRNVRYSAANTRPSLSAWVYQGNGGSINAVAGMKVGEYTMTIEAGQLINAEYTMAGLEFFRDPIEITATSNDLDFTDDAGAQSITLTTGFFKDPHDAASALQTALDATSSQTVTVVYSNTTGKYTWTADGTTFDIDWATTTDTLGAAFGFTADDSSSLTGESDVAIDLTSPQSPSLDTSSPLAAKAMLFQLGDVTIENSCIVAGTITFTLSNELTPLPDVCADSARSGQTATQRVTSVTAELELQGFESEHFKDFRENNTVKMFVGFGPKSGGNFSGFC